MEQGRPWSFDDDGALFRLVSEAHRIRLAHLFDPVLAVHTSIVDPLPHQITTVYEAMLPRQPLHFLLADDPGAGKTIMVGLLIKELIARGDSCSRTISSLSSSKPSAAWEDRRDNASRAATRSPMFRLPVRNRDRLIGIGEPVLARYERVTFEKSLVAPRPAAGCLRLSGSSAARLGHRPYHRTPS